MKGLIITNAYTPAHESFSQVSALKYEFSLKGVAIDIRKNSEILAYINENGEIKTRLKGYDFVIYLDKDPYIAEMIDRSGIKMFNTANAIKLCDDKMLTHIALASSGIRMPKTISSPLAYQKESSNEFKIKLLKELSFPMVIKEVYGSLGKNVYLVKDEKELDILMDKLCLIPHIYQEFIKESYGEDIRVIVIGGRVVAAMKRKSQTGDFRSNISLGGKGYKIDLPLSYKRLAVKVTNILGLDYAGVDILIGKDDKPVLAEVNSNAFFEHISKVTGVSVAQAYTSYILRCMKRN